MECLVNVNELPYPDYSIFETERFYRPMQGKVFRILPMELHRGCPYTCAFCEDPSQNILYKSHGIAKTYHRSKVIRELELYLIELKKRKIRMDKSVKFLFFQ